LREDIGLAHQPAQGIGVAWSAKIEVGCKLAVPSVQFLVPEARQMRAGDPEHVGTMFGEWLRAHVGPARTRVRSRTRMPESGRSPAGSGSVALSPMRTISMRRQRRDRSTLRMARPFGLRSRHAAGALSQQ